MRIGIFGGSFNPIHKGHTALAAALVRIHAVDEVWLMVSPLNPLKQAEVAHIIDFGTRFRLAQLACKRMRHVNACDFESHLPLPSFTVHTLAALARAYPEHQFCLIIGEDNWQCFDRWRQAEDIRARHDIIVYGRPRVGEVDTTDKCDTHAAVRCYHAGRSAPVILPPCRLHDVSSTAVRQALFTGDKDYAHKWLNSRVLQYIFRHHLYSEP